MSRPTATLRAPGSEIEYLVTRSGEPVSIYAHGLTGSIDGTRPFASGVPGTAVFCHLRGHGATRVRDGAWNLDAVAADLRVVADHTGARQAFGVSLGTAALLHILATTPSRFDRAVFMLPPDTGQASTSHWSALADRVADADAERATRWLLAMQPPGVRALPVAGEYYRRMAIRLVGWDGDLVTALRTLPRGVTLPDQASLGRVRVPVLVIGQRGDPLHPFEAAERLADSLPNAELANLGDAGGLWFGRDRVRELITDFLG